MSDADGAGAGDQDLDFGIEKGQLSGTEGLRDAAFSYRRDPVTGELTGGPAETIDRDIGAATVARPEVGGTEPAPEKPAPATEKPKGHLLSGIITKPAEEEKPVITRAKRRRSLLTEEEGGVLRRPTVYRRSILGR